MQRFFVLALSILLASFVGCKKDDLTPSLIGNWELKTSTSGLTGASTIYPSGNGRILRFSLTGYEMYAEGKLTKKGVYKTVKETSAISNILSNRIIYDNEKNSIRTFYGLSDNALSFHIDAYDGPSVGYEKITNH